MAPPSHTRGAFAALLDAATRDADAAEALARAYECLPTDARARLLAAVFEDAALAHLSLPEVVLPLLAVERDPGLARRLAHALHESAGPRGGDALRPAAAHRAVAGFSSTPGDAPSAPRPRALFLVRPLHGRFVETAAVGWDEEGFVDRARVDALRRDDEADAGLRALPDGLRYAPMGFRDGVALLARTLWDHRSRYGALPAGAAPLAAFLHD